MAIDAPSSFGQLYSWREVETYPSEWAHEANLGTTWHLHGMPLDALTATLRRLVEGNEALRTTYHLEHGVPVQRVHPDVLLPIEHVEREVTDGGDGDRTRDALLGEPIPMTDSLGWRGVLVTTGGAPQFLAVSMSHLIVDVWSIRHLEHQFRTMLDGGTISPGPSPRELAAQQLDEPHTGAERYWRRILAEEPMRQLPVLPAGATRHRIQATLHSRQLGGLATHAAGRLGVTAPAILMSLVAAALARHLDTERVTMSMMSSNRFDERLRHAVGTLNQLVPIPVEVDQAATIAEHVKRVHWSAARCYRYSCYDTDRVFAMAAAAGEPDGCWFNDLFRCWFNYLQFDDQVADAADPTPAELVWTPLARQYGQPFDVRVTVRDGRTSVALRVDPDVIPAEALTGILHTVALGTRLAATEPQTSLKDLWSTLALPLPSALFPDVR